MEHTDPPPQTLPSILPGLDSSDAIHLLLPRNLSPSAAASPCLQRSTLLCPNLYPTSLVPISPHRSLPLHSLFSKASVMSVALLSRRQASAGAHHCSPGHATGS